jgi:hypothetical protein
MIVGFRYDSLGRRRWIRADEPRSIRPAVITPRMRRGKIFRCGAEARCQGKLPRPDRHSSDFTVMMFVLGWKEADSKIRELEMVDYLVRLHRDGRVDKLTGGTYYAVNG